MPTLHKRQPTYKKINGRLLQWMDICHELALHRALQELEEQFIAWKNGALSSFEMEEKIHLFHKGPSRQLYNYYVSVSSSMRIVILAGAVRDQLVDVSELRDDIRKQVEELLVR